MDKINQSLFEITDADHEQIAQHQPLDGEVVMAWKTMAVGMVDVVAADYIHAGIEQATARQLAYRAIIALGLFAGGRQFYIPKSMARAMRDKQIYDLFNGNNMSAMEKRFNLTKNMIYRIIAEQKKISISLRQHDWVDDIPTDS